MNEVSALLWTRGSTLLGDRWDDAGVPKIRWHVRIVNDRATKAGYIWPEEVTQDIEVA